MENDPQRVPLPSAKAAHPMAHVHSMNAAPARHRTITNRKHERISTLEGHHHRSRLHARALLGQDKFAAGEIALRFRQKDCELKWENMLAIQILMQAVVIAGPVLKQ